MLFITLKLFFFFAGRNNESSLTYFDKDAHPSIHTIPEGAHVRLKNGVCGMFIRFCLRESEDTTVQAGICAANGRIRF